MFGFEELDFARYTCLNVKDCLLPAVRFFCEKQGRSGGMQALYVKKSQAEEERAARLANGQ